jgi:ATP-dependent DNA helicase RecQ
MSVMAIGNDELLDYVLEKDMEDAVSRVILGCLRGYDRGVGRKRLAKLLRGKDPGYLMNGRDGLRSHFGRLSQLDSDQVLDFIESLTRLGLVQPCPGELPTISISDAGRKALSSRDQIGAMIPWPLPVREIKMPSDPDLYNALKEVRNAIAKEEEVPPYCVVPNSTLVEIVNGGVSDLGSLSNVRGMGKARLEKYGSRLLDALIPHPADA